jgi:hypothetical protein
VNKLIPTLENSFEIYICLQVGITISCHFRLLDGATLHYARNYRALFLIILHRKKRFLKLNAREKTLHTAQLYGVPHRILRVFNTILYENEFQNPQISSERSVLLYLKSRQSLKGNKFWGCQNVLTEYEVLLSTYTALRLSQNILATPEFYAL